MSLKLCVVLFCSYLWMTSCQNGGESPSLEDTNTDELAIAQAVAAKTAFIIPIDLNGDCSFNADIIKNGLTVTAYNTSTVDIGEECLSEVRSCVDGVLSGSYNYANCNVNTAASCLFNGATVLNGQSITAYTNSEVAFGNICEAESRTCNNAVLSGSNQYASCQASAPASCLFNGKTITSGQSAIAYLNSNEIFGNECQLEYRTCDNGVLSGSNQYASCEVAAPASCLFNGQTLANGESVPAYLNSTEKFGVACQIESRTCKNGVLSGSNQYASCEIAAPASCLFNGQTANHGQTLNAYAASNVEYGQMCNVETRVCDNGHLSGSFAFASCDAGQGTSCLFNGVTVPSGASINAYAKSTATDALGCAPETRTCNDGALSGSYLFATCAVNILKSCLFNGTTIQSGQTVTAYQKSDCKVHEKCRAETRLCTDGLLSGSYTQASCKNKKHEDDDADDKDKIKICKMVVGIKHKEGYKEKPANKNQCKSIKYKERFNCGLHKGWYKHKNRHKHPDQHSDHDWYHNKDN